MVIAIDYYTTITIIIITMCTVYIQKSKRRLSSFYVHISNKQQQSIPAIL